MAAPSSVGGSPSIQTRALPLVRVEVLDESAQQPDSPGEQVAALRDHDQPPRAGLAMVSPPGKRHPCASRPAATSRRVDSNGVLPARTAPCEQGEVDDHQRMAGGRRHPPLLGAAIDLREPGPQMRKAGQSRQRVLARELMQVAESLLAPGLTQRAHSPEIGLPSQNTCVGGPQPVQCLTQVGTVTGHLTAHHCARVARVVSGSQVLADGLETCGQQVLHVLGRFGVRRHLGLRAPASQRRKDAHATPHLSWSGHPPRRGLGEVTGPRRVHDAENRNKLDEFLTGPSQKGPTRAHERHRRRRPN